MLSEEYDEGVGAPVLVAETAVRVQWATPAAAAGGMGAPDGGVGMPPGAMHGENMSKQEQLDFAVVRRARPPSLTQLAIPPAPPAADAHAACRSARLWRRTRTSAGRRRLRRSWQTARW